MSGFSRKPFIAGNWKMNLDAASAKSLAANLREYSEKLSNPRAIDITIFPPFVYLESLVSQMNGCSIVVGAQNLCHEDSGAFTGEISAAMIKDLGATQVIVGHSERRHVFGESDDWIAIKLRKAMGQNLNPILCVGEKLEERENNQTFNVVGRQLSTALKDWTATELEKLTVAYEPVWAIGTGKTATADQAGEVHRNIRDLIAKQFGNDAAQKLRIQYGGSVKPENANELFAQSEIDGFLVGGASLVPEKFIPILEAGVQRSTSVRM